MKRTAFRLNGVSEEELKKYTLYSALEISRILDGMKDERQLMRLGFADLQQESVTTILAVDPGRKSFVIDALSDPRQQALAVKSSRLHFEGKLNRITITFSTGLAKAVYFEGSPALEVAFPERLTRLQRRESFRVFVRDSTIRVPFQDTFFTFELRDISQTGCRLLDPDKRMEDKEGQVFADCKLALSDVQPLMVRLEICHAYDIAMPSGQQQRQIGCRFVDLESEKAALIQRYVMMQERKNRALTG